MGVFAGLDVSLAVVAICILDDQGRGVRQGRMDSSTDAVIAALEPWKADLVRSGWRRGREGGGFVHAAQKLEPWQPPTAASTVRARKALLVGGRLVAFRSLVDLQAAINRYLVEHNVRHKPFVWTADPDRIIEKLNRGYQRWRPARWSRERSNLGWDATCSRTRISCPAKLGPGLAAGSIPTAVPSIVQVRCLQSP